LSFQDSCNPTFAGHQTFHPRFGWLKKAVDKVIDDPRVFAREDATLQLGVGKNMVDAIKFWAITAKLIAEQKTALGTEFEVTPFAEEFVVAGGYDPFIEDPLTLWLIHWNLLKPLSNSPVTWLFFNEFSAVGFSQDTLNQFMLREIHAQANLRKPLNPSSVSKDTDVLIRMYSRKVLVGRQTVEDSLDSPFRDLGLIVPSQLSQGAYRVVLGPKPSLPKAAVAVACLEFLAATGSAATSVSISRLANDENSPGKAMKISSESIVELLGGFESLRLTNSAGIQQLIVEGDPLAVRSAILDEYFGRSNV
jgi:hypothetical protein